MHKANPNRKLNYYARILLVISIALLSYGIVLDFNNDRHLLDPYSDITIEEDGYINITTIDDVDPPKEETTPTPAPEVPSVPSSNPNPSTPSSSGTAESKETAPVHVPTIEETNNILRNEIQNTYGIMIRYGSETNGYHVVSGDRTIYTEAITNPTTINGQLYHLQAALASYPSGLFYEIRQGGIPLSVYLINNYSDSNITGITDSSNTYANISIAANFPFEESFFHESYHYIERYLFKRGAFYTTWNSLNPEGFSYGTIYNNLSYNVTFSPDAPFVNNYAQTADTEDRASTFEYMMASSKASCLNEGTVVWAKADYMAKMMRFVLGSVRGKPHSEVRWEQHLY